MPVPAEPRPLVQLSTATTWRGGERQALWLAQGLASAGEAVHIIAPPGSPLALRAQEAGLPVTACGLEPAWNPLCWWRLRGLLRTLGARLVHAHDAHAATLASWGGWLARIPALCTRRVDFAINSPKTYNGLAAVICISEAVRTVCAQGGIAPAKLPVVRSGIEIGDDAGDPLLAPARAALLPAGKRLLVLNVASLVDHKDHATLLVAMQTVLAKLPNAHLVIAGDGELAADLAHQAHLLALTEDVTFLGFRDDIPALLAACDLFVMSSKLEGLNTSVMDAMAAGRAVVVTAAGGMPELVQGSTGGVVVPTEDPAALANALISVLEDRKQREKMHKAARRQAQAQFSKEQMVAGTQAVYRTILG